MSSLVQRFDPELSVNSGQAFLWEKVGGSWYGIHGSRVVRFTNMNGAAEFASFPDDVNFERSMFRLDDDIGTIMAEISKDALVRRLVQAYPGLRLMRQEPEQCLFSFLCASNTNIPMIRRMLYTLCNKFGKSVVADGKEFHVFPSAAAIDAASVAELRACGLGYRVRALKSAARMISDGKLDLGSLRKAGYEDAKAGLLQVYGVGPKIADCVLLFSLEKLDAFPIDVWIARALTRHYRWLHQRKAGDKLTARQYDDLSAGMRRYFGQYAGYAQQYLYYHMRQRAGKKW